MVRLLALAVCLDALTFAVLPPASEANFMVRALGSTAVLVRLGALAFLVSLVTWLQRRGRELPFQRALLLCAALSGMIGAASNVSVLIKAR